MRKLKHIWMMVIMICIFIIPANSVHGQDKHSNFTTPLYKRFTASYIFGAQVYNNTFVYDPGFSAMASLGKSINEDLKLGIGCGIINLTNEDFVPVFSELIAYKKDKKNTPFIIFQTGYSFVTNSQTDNLINYNLIGGIYINAGIGRKIAINDGSSLMLNWTFCHQFASMQYKLFENHNYKEPIHYNMLMISISYLFN